MSANTTRGGGDFQRKYCTKMDKQNVFNYEGNFFF